VFTINGIYLWSFGHVYSDQLCPREAEFKFNNNFVDRIYPIELEIKDTTDRSTSYLDLHLGISDKIDDLKLSI
jgi:hypothetical protein